MALLTKQELAEKMQISVQTVERYMKKGMPKYKLMRSVRFDLEEVKKWIKENQEEK